MRWGRKWKMWPKRDRGFGVDPREWQTWLQQEYNKLAQRLSRDLATGRISRTAYERRRAALDRDYHESRQRHAY